ncbi:CPBP family intramembrane glutamic endopeptidase [Rhodococcus sp. TAF43]|uniref:CPBP family intramembrane glutamic endopeptidase n=1 Tax=Rhodococcus sp. TAF43 TaxID=3237483 RepID=UPI003F974E77
MGDGRSRDERDYRVSIRGGILIILAAFAVVYPMNSTGCYQIPAIAAAFIVVFACALLSERTWRRACAMISRGAAAVGFTRPATGWAMTAVLIAIAWLVQVLLMAGVLAFDAGELTMAQQEANDARTEAATSGGLVGALAFSFISTALPEELVFRGPVLLAQRYASHRAWVLPGVTVSVIVRFGLAHYKIGWGNVISAGSGAAVLTALALRTWSIWPPILAHGIFNAAIVALG